MERSIRFSSKASLGVCGASLKTVFAVTKLKIERVQRRATRVPTDFEKLEYEGGHIKETKIDHITG